jgi:hypothetical protein
MLPVLNPQNPVTFASAGQLTLPAGNYVVHGFVKVNAQGNQASAPVLSCFLGFTDQGTPDSVNFYGRLPISQSILLNADGGAIATVPFSNMVQVASARQVTLFCAAQGVGANTSPSIGFQGSVITATRVESLAIQP